MKNEASRPKVPPPPSGYTPEAKKLWRRVTEGWELDEAALEILDTVICRSFMTERRAQEQLDRDGLTMLDRFKQPKAHPAATIANNARITFLKGLRALGLDLEPIRDGVGRPGGR